MQKTFQTEEHCRRRSDGRMSEGQQTFLKHSRLLNVYRLKARACEKIKINKSKTSPKRNGTEEANVGRFSRRWMNVDWEVVIILITINILITTSIRVKLNILKWVNGYLVAAQTTERFFDDQLSLQSTLGRRSITIQIAISHYSIDNQSTFDQR